MKGKMFMKKIVAFVLAFVLVLSMSITASASEIPNETAIVKTWTNDAGEKVTGIITQGSEVLAAQVNPEGVNKAKGFITGHENEGAIISYAYDEYQVSDYFYMQIYNSNDQVVAKYKITVTGMVSRVSSERYITSIAFSRVSGDTCSTNYSIDGYNATVIITHPQEGYLDAYITLGTGGSFTIY